MSVNSLRKSSLDPFKRLSLIKRYFTEVKSMDQKAVAGKPYEVDAILKLWNEGGELFIHGPEPIGERRFKGTKKLAEFYTNRAKGARGTFQVNLSKVNVANAKGDEQVLVSGARYVVNKNKEGMQVPFAHSFRMASGKIDALEITVGKAAPTDIAPIGTLSVKDLGRLSAMAWMVA